MAISINDFNSLIQIDPPKQVKRTTRTDTALSTKALSSDKSDIFEKRGEIRQFEITHFLEKTKAPKTLNVEHNTLDKGILYKKVIDKKTGRTEKIPFEVDIAKSKKNWTVTYHFLDPETKEEIGYVTLDDWRLAKNDPVYDFYLKNSRLTDDFPELGIVGDRVSIDFLQNNKEDTYCGIGTLADQIALEYCLKEGITPNVTSVADLNSHAAHYQRGRRFFILDKNDPDIDYYDFKEEYGTDDPNKIVEERIKNTPKGQKADTSDLCGIYMYMPQDVVKMYLRRIKENPLLH